MKRYLFLHTLLATIAFVLAGCGSPASESAKSSPHYVSTVGMIADVVRNVVGDRGQVDSVMGPGTDPHVYTPRRSDLDLLSRADMIFYHGLMLEGRMADALASMASRTPTIAVGERILAADDMLEENGEPDPHVWMNVEYWIAATGVVAEELAKFDPPNADHFRTQAAAYEARLKALHEYAKTVMSSIPEEHRVLMTAHDAFAYFGAAYGIEVHGIQGISTASEAGLQDINRMVDFLVEKKIPAIFVESTVSDKNVRALMEGAASRGHQVVIGGNLYSDAMGTEGTYEGTYIGMIDHNVTTIARALGGQAPERGLNGMLSGNE